MKSDFLIFSGSVMICMVLWVHQVHSQNSVLTSGEWHQLAVSETGIYRITYDDLLDFGINPALINPKFVRIYGNGSQMLPEVNDAFRYEDLVENAIYVSGEDNEVFDPGDYILFYGEKPVTWILNTPGGFFKHRLHGYSEITCYFLNFDTGPGKRIILAEQVTDDPTHIRSTCSARLYHELEAVNLIRSGRRWFGEAFDDQPSYSWTFTIPHLVLSGPVIIDVAFAARSPELSSLSIKMNGNLVKSMEVLPVDLNSTHFARFKQDSALFLPDSNELTIELEYIKPNGNSIAWLDYFTLNYSDSLILTGNQLLFRDISSVGTGHITLFKVAGADAQTRIWNVTDPVNIKSVSGALSEDVLEISVKTDSLQEFIAFNNDVSDSPVYMGTVENQNIRGSDPVDYVIVVHEDFKDQAEQLADFHETINNLTTLVVTPGRIYNEFSSGMQDITAIRDFVKQMYDQTGGEQPKYLLLFGNASFDYKDILEENTNFVPAWQSPESLNRVSSMCSDDYYGWLDNGEGITGFMDIGIGRLPVNTAAEATAIVNKIIGYATNPATFGNWKNEVCFVADDGNANIFLDQAEGLTGFVTGNSNITKNYLDFYALVQTPDGPRYPEAKAHINTKMDEGVMLINYTGHGGPLYWATEKVLEPEDIESWQNTDRLPVMIAASCEFARFDDPAILSSGMQALLKSNGGVIGLFGTVRLSFANSNFQINEKLAEHFFDPGVPFVTLGSMMLHAKTMQSMTHRIWTLLGDPALRVTFPEYIVHTDSINGVHFSNMTDTIAPGGVITVSGHIQNNDGIAMAGVNGNLLVKVFEKQYQLSTLGNDPSSVIVTVDMQDSLLLSLEDVVVNGRFNISFALPVDMAEDFGNIRLSYYAFNNEEDASGHYNQITVGGKVSSIETMEMDHRAFQLFPSVTTGHFFISFNGHEAAVDLCLFDMTGIPVFVKQFPGITDGTPYRIDLPYLTPGLYLARLQAGNTLQTFKVVVR
jgi:hypothetical protein